MKKGWETVHGPGNTLPGMHRSFQENANHCQFRQQCWKKTQISTEISSGLKNFPQVGANAVNVRDSAILNIPVIESHRAVIPAMLLSGNPGFLAADEANVC